MVFEELFRFHRRHAARSGCRDGLTVASVNDITAGKDAGHTSQDVIGRFQIAVFVVIQLIAEDFGVRLMADPKKVSLAQLRVVLLVVDLRRLLLQAQLVDALAQRRERALEAQLLRGRA